MKTIELTGKRASECRGYVIVDDADYEWLSRHRWQAQITKVPGQAYAVRSYGPRPNARIKLRMHRQILGLEPGVHVEGDLIVDHINGDTLDNRRNNLRLVTRKQNSNNPTLALVMRRCCRCLAWFTTARRPGLYKCGLCEKYILK